MDIAFHVAKLGHFATKFPVQVVKDSLKVLAYLASTSNVRLRYGKFEEAWAGEQTLRFSRGLSVVESWSDASFAQADERSQSGIALVVAGGLISWHSSRQGLVSLSTAESEMISAVESLTLARALVPIWAELTKVDLNWVLYLEILACTHLLVLPGGAWRTRHLRLRAHHFREAIEAGSLAIHHLPGIEMLSDILTKSMHWHKVWHLLSLAGCVQGSATANASSGMTVESAVRMLVFMYAASHLPATAAVDDADESLDVWTVSTSEWLVIGCVVLIWEGFRFLFPWCKKVRVPPKETQTRVDGSVLCTELQESHQGSSLGEQANLLELSRQYGLPSMRLQGTGSEDYWEIYPEYKVLVRWHVVPRQQLFRPINEFPLGNLVRPTGLRRTIMCVGPEDIREHHDNFRQGGSRRRGHGGAWTGRTEFQVVMELL